jgi:energy-coupling factor transport system permease protein
MVNVFKSYHPIVNFIYFVLVIGFSMFVMHPVLQVISFACSILYLCTIRGGKTILYDFLFLIPLLIFTTLINPLINHNGNTVLMYLPTGAPFTLEALFYGISAGMMLASVVAWFMCFNEVMTDEKLMYLFGRTVPALSLVFSMTLKLVPNLKIQIKKFFDAQKCIGKDISGAGFIRRAKHSMAVFSAVITWSFENALETADSMKSRGFGLQGRTSYSIYSIEKKDKKMITVLICFGIGLIYALSTKKIYFNYYPYITVNKLDIYAVGTYAAYTLLCSLPVIVHLNEVTNY